MDSNLAALSEFRQNNKRLQQKLKDMSVDPSFIKPLVDAAGKPIPATNAEAFPELLKQFTELSAIALNLGLTRVVTLQLGDSYGTNFTSPLLNGRNKLTFERDMHFSYGHDFLKKYPIDWSLKIGFLRCLLTLAIDSKRTRRPLSRAGSPCCTTKWSIRYTTASDFCQRCWAAGPIAELLSS